MTTRNKDLILGLSDLMLCGQMTKSRAEFADFLKDSEVQ